MTFGQQFSKFGMSSQSKREGNRLGGCRIMLMRFSRQRVGIQISNFQHTFNYIHSTCIWNFNTQSTSQQERWLSYVTTAEEGWMNGVTLHTIICWVLQIFWSKHHSASSTEPILIIMRPLESLSSRLSEYVFLHLSEADEVGTEAKGEVA